MDKLELVGDLIRLLGRVQLAQVGAPPGVLEASDHDERSTLVSGAYCKPHPGAPVTLVKVLFFLLTFCVGLSVLQLIVI